MKNRICDLFKIQYPIIQGGMVWCSGWRLASAVSNAGGLGLIGAGSMYPEVFEEHILKCKAATNQPFGVNIPLLYPNVDQLMDIILKTDVKIVFTSAGNPKTWTSKLKEQGITVVHVVSSSKFALKSQDAGVDAVVAEGFEAGGHNGREETSTMVLIPQVCKAVQIPVMAAGGIIRGQHIAAAMALGADGVQLGTRFALAEESSAHINFKQHCLQLAEGETLLSLKKVSPTRVIKNGFYQQIQTAEDRGASASELAQILGKGRSKKGIFEGDLLEGELEIGQGASAVDQIESVAEIMKSLIEEYNNACQLKTW